MRHWFLPQTPDVLGLLEEQVTITIEGIDAFAAWSAGKAELADTVEDREHAADVVRRELQSALRSAFSTPLDAQDIYELSERLDAILNGARNAVREAELMQFAPNAPLATMAAEVAAGVRHLQAAFAVLTTDPGAATIAADAAIGCERRIERAYRPAMSELVGVEDVRQVIAWREMYRRYARLGDAVVRVAERVWYAVVKA